MLQVLSGTGGGRIAFEFVARFVGKNTPFYMPDPTWANHLPMAKDAGLSLATYRCERERRREGRGAGGRAHERVRAALSIRAVVASRKRLLRKHQSQATASEVLRATDGEELGGQGRRDG